MPFCRIQIQFSLFLSERTPNPRVHPFFPHVTLLMLESRQLIIMDDFALKSPENCNKASLLSNKEISHPFKVM